ncbi:TIGR04141 family sporadically distributed protein [Uliginosibacterium aquaticum]|uniref:TIGR04141 family sporadically distributed protein n=1 Tax=Uliginosibacterium aquaticum TaxID=2731212 RepID=A0ABX2IBU6_9RHOO|nr:TIGR04141 family sporadically distributed protein [Uliginosibacterium aquaticum]NSL53945.1 TIGR04141 family sporadically distributed protein [Uliginosibacterium aquaticum]
MADKPYRHLNLFMAKPDATTKTFAELLAPESNVSLYNLDPKFEFDGALYVKRSSEKRPKWSEVVDLITGVEIPYIGTKSSSAVLFLRTENALFAFTFGYGRYLIETTFFIQDFGLKTALNILNHESLRSVDLHTLEDQPVQKKSQATRESEASIFGIDISRDVLRAVTGSPKPGINLRNISGGDAMLSFGAELDIEEIPGLAAQIYGYYTNDDYKSGFSWVDNVRRIKEKGLIDRLDATLVEAIKEKDQSLVITLPEIGKWDSITGFSFTRSKSTVSPTIQIDSYYSGIDVDSVSIESVKRDRLFVFDIHEDESDHSIYKCIYFEKSEAEKTYVLFCGIWYEIDNTFMGRINSTLDQIEISDLDFPAIEIWDEAGDKKIETEGDYNIRAANAHGYHLLDKKLIKSNKTTSSIELCDLLTPNKQLIHVKHRKGGSAGLSHLFAQGSVSAEIMLGDKAFRKAARTVLARINATARDIIPLDNPRSVDYEVVFLILGDEKATVKGNLPFFSKVNLSRAYENLSQRGFPVKISAAPKVDRPVA